jgi:hypothetical protein
MTFLELLQKLEAQLGYHQLPLHTSPTTLKNLFETICLHHELMLRLVQAIYRTNRCHKLTDPVDHRATLEAFAPLRLEVVQSKHTDVDLFRFVDELCVALDQAFGTGAPARVTAKQPTHNADVVDIARFRRRFKTLA